MLQSQDPCLDITYDVTVTEYRTIQKGTSFTDVLSVDLPKFVNRKYYKKINKYFDDYGKPVILESINDHQKYFPITMKLPLISIYGQTTEERLILLTNGVYDQRLKNYTILNEYGNFVFDDMVMQKGFLHYMKFQMPGFSEIQYLINEGFDVTNQSGSLQIADDSMSIIFDKVNLTITEEYFFENYKSITYYTTQTGGDTLRNHSVEAFRDTLTNGLCSQLTVITAYENYSCASVDQGPTPREGTKEYVIDNIMIYPNPTSGLLYVDIPESLTNESAQVTIANAAGKILKSFNIASDARKIALKTDAIFETEGLYLITITGAGKVWNSKFFYSQLK